MISKHEKKHAELVSFLGIYELANILVTLAVRAYCNIEDYWEVYFDINERMNVALDNNIFILFPQRDVNLFNA